MAKAIMCVVPAESADQLTGIWIGQQLAWIEAMTTNRLVGTVNPVTVNLPWPSIQQVTVPHFVRELG